MILMSDPAFQGYSFKEQIGTDKSSVMAIENETGKDIEIKMIVLSPVHTGGDNSAAVRHAPNLIYFQNQLLQAVSTLVYKLTPPHILQRIQRI